MRINLQHLGLPSPRHSVCLYVHAVQPPPFPDGLGPNIFMPPGELQSALQVLAAHTRPQSLTEVVGDAKRNWTGPRAITLTFDDGFRDNLSTALPLLEKYDVPATIFITTGFVDREVLPYEHVLAAVLTGRDQITVDLPAGRRSYSTATAKEKIAAYRECASHMKPAPLAVRNRFIESLAPENAVVEGVRNLYLDWDEVSRLHAHPLITIGAHTRSHLALTYHDPRVALAEMVEDRQRLSAQLGTDITSFAFPYGRHDATAIALAREAGFTVAVTTRRNVLRPDTDPLAVPRCELRHASQSAHYARAVIRK